jgi:hypothetical protein
MSRVHETDVALRVHGADLVPNEISPVRSRPILTRMNEVLLASAFADESSGRLRMQGH